MSLRGEDALILAQDYVDETLKGAGALKGQDGVSPIISVNTSTADTYKLDITDKNGTITTPNLVGKQGLQGIQGEQGKPADNPIVTENADNTEDVYKLDLTVGETVFTTKNIIGKQGLEGVSPSVTTNPDNTAEDYRLNITTKGGTFTTPNLRGPQGEIGPQGESAASAINPRGDYDVNADPHYTVSDYITSAEGNTYVCKKDNPDNVAPTDGTINDEFWQVLALRGAKGESGKDGEKGADGVTFTPSIDTNGVLSFTNNGGLENPEPIDIKGDNGITFTPSIDAEGYLSFTNDGNLENPEPIKVLGQDGADGKDGIDGTTYIPSIGTVTTVENNADASAGVTVDEETKEAVFHFEIPKGEDGFSPIVETVESENGHTVNITDVEGVKSFEVLNGKDGVQIDDTTTSTDTVWSSKKTSDEIAEVETELNAKLGDKADKTELNKRREIRVDEIYDSNSYYRVDAIGYYARPLYFRVVSTNGGEEILSFGQSVTSERKVIGKSVNATFKYIPPTSNASNGTLFIKTNKVDTSLTIFYTQIYSVASIPTLRDSTAEEYATGTDFNVQELATMDKVKDGYAKIIKNNDTDTNDAMFISYKNRDLFGIRIYKDDNSEHELRFSASGISYVKDGVTVWTK